MLQGRAGWGREITRKKGCRTSRLILGRGLSNLNFLAAAVTAGKEAGEGNLMVCFI